MISFSSDEMHIIRDQAGTWLCIRSPQAQAVYEKYKGKSVSFTAKSDRKKRSLDANSYYWATLNELATALNVSTPYLHNLMLRRYGQPEMRYGGLICVMVPDTDECAKRAEEDEFIHLKPTSRVSTGKDGNLYRTYILMKGSHAYDTKEMSRLIDGLLAECRETGVEPRQKTYFE